MKRIVETRTISVNKETYEAVLKMQEILNQGQIYHLTLGNVILMGMRSLNIEHQEQEEQQAQLEEKEINGYL